jgi:hypothetical protein
MSRVHYTNDTIQKAFTELDQLEQTIGWNMRCGYPGEYGWKLGELGGWQPPPTDNTWPPNAKPEDYHQGAMSALVQTLEHFPKLRRLLDQVEAEVLKVFLNAQEEEKKWHADRDAEAKAKGFMSVPAMSEHYWLHDGNAAP